MAYAATALLSVGCTTPQVHVAPSGSNAATRTPESSASVPRFVSPYTYEHFIRAELARAKGDLAGAIDGYRRALAGADEDTLVIARLAVALNDTGRANDADELLARGDDIDPQSEAIWMARGQIAERRQQRDAAIAAYERAETYAPLSPAPALALAHALNDAPERALAVLRRFSQRNERWNAHRLHVELSIALSSSDLDAAVSALRALRTVTHATAKEVEATAQLALERDRPILARELLGTSEEQADDRNLRLRVLLATRDYAAARRLLDGSTPEDVGGLAAMAALYLEVGELDSAADLATTAIQGDPHGSAVLTLLRARGLEALANEVETHATAP